MDTPDHSNRGHAEFGPSGLKYVALTDSTEQKGLQRQRNEGPGSEVSVHDPSALHDEEEVEIYDK